MKSAPEFKIPFEKYALENGMRVILSPDRAVPVVTVYLVYGVGARAEQRGRTGFAHLFEHMMFQGSENAPKGAHFHLVESNGGAMNGSTHPDYTDYFEVLPSNKLALGLWLEADRMRALAITAENLENQKQAVKQERRLSVDNQPYATAIVDRWPELAFDNWQNSHSLIGSFEDLEAATVEDVARFFRTHYAPNNAVLAISGDFDVGEAKELISDVVFVELPKLDRVLKKKDSAMVIESVKAAFDIYAPVSGKVVKVNDKLKDKPELVNKSPYEEGWLYQIECSDVKEADSLLTEAQYNSVKEAAH